MTDLQELMALADKLDADGLNSEAECLYCAVSIATKYSGLRSPAFAEMARNDARYRFLRDMKCCTFSLSRDEGHGINYETFESFAEASPEWYADVPEDELQKMRETNTDWALQIYPDTPIGFYVWHAATLDMAIDAAIDAQRHGRGES